MSLQPRSGRMPAASGGIVGCLLILALAGCSTGADVDTRISQSVAYTSIPNFSPAEAERLSTKLRLAAQAHDICYGWRLEDAGTDRVSQGSSEGPTTPADSCGQWVELQAIVGYTSEASSARDAAEVRVAGSQELDVITPTDLFDIGIDAQALVADPVGAVGMGTLALPLLLAEYGKVEPLPEAAGQPPAQGNPLPPADSDGPIGEIVLLIVVLVGAAVCAVVGVVSLRRGRAKATEGTETK